jgi:peptidoglycan/LPS O-acetylase OafA/YrhL
MPINAPNARHDEKGGALNYPLTTHPSRMRELSMSESINRQRPTNNLGALRLFFAVLVILSHSPELIDGDRSREILTRVFGTLSFGGLGVDGFFLISGYLITKSFQESPSVGGYVLKRVLRIYPGYLAAYLLCVLVLGPLVGAQVSKLSSARVLAEILTLHGPGISAFPGSAYPVLDGAMWTIAYEFRCYLLVMAAGLAGLLSKRSIIAFWTSLMLLLSALDPNIWNWVPAPLEALLGQPNLSAKFVGVFGCGALFYLYRDRLRFEATLALAAGCGLISLMFWASLAEAAVATLGGYVLFWFAFRVKWPSIASIGSDVDISYGVYLYAWPIQKLLIWSIPGISPWLVFAETTAIAGLLGLASWWLVEQPALSFKNLLVSSGLDRSLSKAHPFASTRLKGLLPL